LEFLNKIYDDYFGSNHLEEESFLFGTVFPFEDIELVIQIMNSWVNLIDLKLDKLEEYGGKYVDLFKKRGFTIAEYKMVLSGKAAEDVYLDERVYAYLYIDCKEDLNYFISDNTYDTEKTILQKYTKVLEKYIINEIEELHHFF
jgi:hypothetical protein